ncbi:MAG: class I SAM-dependent methyltransferase, partial [Tepidisphaeraceae bacterium]
MPFNPLDYPILFTCPLLMTEQSAWIEHIPFAYMLTQMCRPTRLVELGTQRGDSYCAFCQAVTDLQLPTRCFAVDTWQGDEHTGPYSDTALKELRAHHDPRYGSFSTLMHITFDEAVKQFADQSIDLLHIDGLHTYE